MLTGRKPRRFYTEVAVDATARGYAVALDRRPARTPGGAPLAAPTAALAEAIAAEWRRQDGVIDLQDMPLTRIANTAIDRVPDVRVDMIGELMRFGETDLLCYRVSEPADLAERQHAAWQPLLDWAGGALGARLEITRGVRPIPQPESALAALRAALDRASDMTLAALGLAVPASGSLVTGLALAAGRVDAATACAVAEVEEAYQNERWGEDREALERRVRVRGDIRAGAEFLALCREDS